MGHFHTDCTAAVETSNRRHSSILFYDCLEWIILAATFISDEKAYTLPVLLQSYVGDYLTMQNGAYLQQELYLHQHL